MEYVEDLIRNGSRILPGSAGTYWAGYESTTMVRIPTFHLGPPTASEVRHVLWCGSAVTGCYLLEPDSRHPAKAWLYLCTDRSMRELRPQDSMTGEELSGFLRLEEGTHAL
jgi:hypothetical protein